MSEISIPRPWTPEKERTVYNNCLEQVKLADALGFEHVWAVEHHFLEEYSHCSAPELFLTACAVLTQNIKVGHGIVVCVPEFNHPIIIIITGFGTPGPTSCLKVTRLISGI